MTQLHKTQRPSATFPSDLKEDVEFDQWAKAVRQQMIAALKRRGNG